MDNKVKIKIKKNDFIFYKDLIIESNEKNIVLFAPNGCGKTTIFNSIKNGDGEINDENVSSESLFLNDNTINEIYSNNIYETIKKNSISYNSFLEKEQKLRSEIYKITNFDNFQICDIKKILQQGYDVNKYKDEINNKKEILDLLNKDEITNITVSQFKKILNELNKLNYIEKKKIHILEILNKINDKKLNDDFMFKNNGKFIASTIENIEELKKEIEKKYPEDILLAGNKILEYYGANFFDSSSANKKIKGVINDLKDELDKIEFNIKIVENKEHLESIINDFNECSEKLIKETNRLIDRINNYFKKYILEWKLNLNKIEDLYKYPNNPLYKYNDKEYEELKSSNGEGKILNLIVYLIINSENSKKKLIIDDVFSSMDLNHMDEFVSIIKTIKFNTIIIMTHNFELFRELSRKNSDEYSFWILDKTINSNICFSINKEDLYLFKDTIRINSFSNPNIKKEEGLKPYELLFQFSTFREIIWNFIINKKEMEKDEYDYMLSWIRLIDNNIRHNRGCKKIEDIFKEIEKIEKNYKINISTKDRMLISNLPQFKYIKEISKDFKEKSIKEIVINDIQNEEEHPIEFLNFSNTNIIPYIIYKNFLGFKTRFIFEQKFIYDTKNQKKINDWENIKDVSTCKKFEKEHRIKEEWENSDLKSFNENFITHLNSFQWNRIIEMPIKKIQIALKTIKTKKIQI